MGFNIGAGLSEMGGSLAQTAAQMQLERQKSDLETQKELLVDQLTTARESKGRQEQAGIDMAARTQSSSLAVGAAKQEDIDKASLAIEQAPKLAAAQRDISKQNASDPTYLKSLRLIADASATPEQRAAAQASAEQIIGLKLQNAAAQEVEDARTELKQAEKAGDNDAIQAAQRRMAVATYSAKDEVQAAAAAKGVADSARMYVESLDARIARITASAEGDTDAGKAQVAQLNTERSGAERTYDSLQASAIAAAKNVPDINLGRNKQYETLPSSQKDLVVGKTYDTAKGPAKWNGTQFVPIAASAAKPAAKPGILNATPSD